MNRFLISCFIGLLVAGSGPALGADKDSELAAARAEVERAREELRDATRQLQRLLPDDSTTIVRLREMVTESERPMVGVVLAETDNREGVRLAAVTPGGPAEKAGLRSGQVVVAINGEQLKGRNAVPHAYGLLENMAAGDRYEFTVREDGQEQQHVLIAENIRPGMTLLRESFDGMNFNLELPRLEELETSMAQLRDRLKGHSFSFSGNLDNLHVWNFGWNWSGLELARMNQGLGRYFGTTDGALVLESRLEDQDLLAGDVIVAVAGEPVSNPTDAMRHLRSIEPGANVELEVIRDSRPVTVQVTSPERTGNAFFYEFETADED